MLSSSSAARPSSGKEKVGKRSAEAGALAETSVVVTGSGPGAAGRKSAEICR